MDTHIDLKDKRILITGASQGIGREIAQYVMKMGAQVAVHYNSNKKAAAALIPEINTANSMTFKADLNSESETISLFNDVVEKFGSLDVIILNAAVFIEHSTFDDLEDWYNVWKKTININLNAIGLLTKLGIDHFRTQGGGRFIYIGSRAAFRGETEEFLAYATSKGGITSLARSVARSFGKENIKSFIIAPGFTRTQMAQTFIEKYGEERVLNEIALNELTKPEDISPLIALLCSGLMDHATGATIDINAGSHIR